MSKKPVVIWVGLLLLLGLNLTANVSSDANVYDDGVWFDAFEDENDIDNSNSSNYNFSEGCITLGSGTNIFYYDFDVETDEELVHNARATDLIFIASENELLRPINLLGENWFSYNDYDAIKKKNDSNVVETQARYLDMERLGLEYTFSPVHHFRFKINQDKNNIKNITFSWWYGNKTGAANVDLIHLYAWDYSALLSRWIKQGTGVQYANIGLNNATGDICFTINDLGYVSDDGYVDFLVIGIPKNEGDTCILTTDYVNLTVTAKEGYLEEGYVVSTEIDPENLGIDLGRWESVIWSSSKTSNVSSVIIQVLELLEGNWTVIDDLSGKTSPVASLKDTDADKIKLKALLHSNDLSVTPRLYSWGVTWQTKNGRFLDSFSTDLRIDKGTGVDIGDGDIKMSGFYSDWSIFGKNSVNTRSCEGDGPQENTLYWYTKKETVGGGSRSPVLNDGVIYIASSADEMIYAFNATVSSNKIGKEIQPFDSSNPSYSYVVDSSVAVADGFVIVATSETKASNKIIALDKTNLSDEKWRYPGADENICFSSAPTVSNGRVFVTSWNGGPGYTPLLSFIYRLQLLKGNNKIIALNLVDGAEVWAKDLPAGSFSAPAVADGMVFVGCDNIYGNSLFAFDEETGEKIWNTSVGLVGGSSPVVYDNKVFIVVKEQGLLSLRGTIKIVAVDEYRGEILWNYTLAENVRSFENIPKGLRLYNLMITSTPAVNENVLYVTSADGKVHALDTDGEVKWSVDLSSAAYGLIPSFSCTSPVVAHDDVYVAMPNGIVYALSVSDGGIEWEFDCDVKDPELLAPTYILSSPIVVDGVLYVSVTEELKNLSGRIYSIGDYTYHQRATVISNPIHVPTFNWWEKFNADNSTQENASITFSILDENYNILRDNVKDDSNISDSTEINSDVIRLRADFWRKNKSQDPTLDSWSVTWEPETDKPVFDENSFIPDPSGWINNNKPECSIKVQDTESGLDVDSARYRIEYISDEDEPETSKWIYTYCSGENGTRKEETIKAYINLDISENIAVLKSITISIKDLAGNRALPMTKTFKNDVTKPSSSIKDAESLSSKCHNSPVVITADASDPGDPDVNKSGIKNVALYYRPKDTTSWTEFDTCLESPYKWSFRTINSSHYEFLTIATDRAGNIEDKDQVEVSFVFDMNEPYKPDFAEEYRFNKLPGFTIEFKDDYELESVYYRLNFDGSNEWTKIKDNINSESYNGKWSLTQSHWDHIDEGKNYYIYFKLIDSCGNQYVTPSNEEGLKIIKDVNVSESYLNLSDFQEWHWDNMFTIHANLSMYKDIANVELHYRYSANNENWSEWKQYGDNLTTSPFDWEFTTEEGSGYYEFKIKIWDAEGRMEELTAEPVEVTLFPLIPITALISLAVVFAVVTKFILVKMKKKKA